MTYSNIHPISSDPVLSLPTLQNIKTKIWKNTYILTLFYPQMCHIWTMAMLSSRALPFLLRGHSWSIFQLGAIVFFHTHFASFSCLKSPRGSTWTKILSIYHGLSLQNYLNQHCFAISHTGLLVYPQRIQASWCLKTIIPILSRIHP